MADSSGSPGQGPVGAAQSIDENRVLQVAKLSRLKLTGEDVRRYAGQLSGILDYVNQLSEVNVDGVEPMAHPLPLHNVLREDVVEPSLPLAKVLDNAPGKDGAFFTVPKVLDTGMSSG